MTATLEAIAEQIESGRLEEAHQALETAQVGDDDRAEALYLGGYVKELTYDRIGALDSYGNALDHDPDHTKAAFRAALICDLGGDEDSALGYYKQCTSNDSVHVNALINLAVLYEERGKLEDAKLCLQAVLEKFPNHIRARHYLKSVLASYTMMYDEHSHRARERHDAVLDTSVADFELSVRSRNCLRQMNIRTLGDLLNTTEAELLTYKNFGETSLNEIKAMLSQRGLELGQSIQSKENLQPVPVEEVAGGDAAANWARPVSELELSVRSRKCLQLLGLGTIGELAMCSESELMATKNFGQTSLTEISMQMARFGLSLRA
jgi:DNA-directed RNA polymerase subunit alpha